MIINNKYDPFVGFWYTIRVKNNPSAYEQCIYKLVDMNSMSLLFMNHYGKYSILHSDNVEWAFATSEMVKALVKEDKTI